MSEGVVVRLVRELAPVWWPGCHLVRQNSGRKGGVAFGEVGLPDFLGFDGAGRALAVECKTATGRLSEDQERWLANAHRTGVLCYVAVGEMPDVYRWGDVPSANLPRRRP